MAKIIGSPSRYVQGKGELKNLCGYSNAFAKKLFFILFSNLDFRSLAYNGLFLHSSL